MKYFALLFFFIDLKYNTITLRGMLLRAYLIAAS
jgi:hypothetical protein